MAADLLRATILGCGSSSGVPRLGGPGGRGEWGLCDPAEPRNRRRRCALLIERVGARGVTRLLIDAGPDLREQLLSAGVDSLDAVAITHQHADHIHGLDDLRALALLRRARLPLFTDAPTADILRGRFGYCFVTPPGSSYPPILDLHEIDGEGARVTGAGGSIDLRPFWLVHGDIMAMGFRVGPLAYSPDVNAIPEAAWTALEGTRIWIVDALRRTPHPSHAHLDLTLSWIDRLKPRRAIITNMHIDLDYRTLAAELPPGVEPAYDGLVIETALE